MQVLTTQEAQEEGAERFHPTRPPPQGVSHIAKSSDDNLMKRERTLSPEREAGDCQLPSASWEGKIWTMGNKTKNPQAATQILTKNGGRTRRRWGRSGAWEWGRDSLGRGGTERGSSEEMPPLKVSWALDGTPWWPRAGFLLPGFTPQSPKECPTIPTAQARLNQLHPDTWGWRGNWHVKLPRPL